jgi:hypothetical protein
MYFILRFSLSLSLSPSLSFSLSVEGPVFAEVIHGKKLWFLYPPEADVPPYDPLETSLRWFVHNYPQLSVDRLPQRCALEPGEVLYVPDMWHHATLNVGQTIFMSIFV